MTAPALFETIPLPANIEDLPAPENGPYFVISKRSLLVHKTFHFGRVLVPVSEHPTLPELQGDAFLWHSIPRLPAALVGQAWSFFRTIWETRKSEAEADITWDTTHGYRLFIPPQHASGGGVKVKRNMEHYARGSQLVGTLHSHCNFGAFHSGTDTHDADGHDGLHLTIGHVDRNPPEVAVMISASKKRWDLKLEDVIDGELELVPHPHWWVRFVGDPEPTTHESWKPAAADKPWTRIWKPSEHPTTKTVIGARQKHWPSIDALMLDKSYADQLDQQGQDNLDEIAMYLDEITRAFDELGLDFDYEISPSLLPTRLPVIHGGRMPFFPEYE